MGNINSLREPHLSGVVSDQTEQNTTRNLRDVPHRLRSERATNAALTHSYHLLHRRNRINYFSAKDIQLISDAIYTQMSK